MVRPLVEPLEDRMLLAADWAEPNDIPTAPFFVGHIEGSLQYRHLSIDSTTDQDWYQFHIFSGGNSSHHVAITFPNSQGDLDIELYYGSQLVGKSTTTGDREAISLAGLPEGTYFLHVYGYHGATNRYDLEIAAPGYGYEPNNSPSQASYFVLIRDEYTFGGLSIDSIDAATGGDWYKFDLPRTGLAANFVGIDFTHSLGDLDLKLYDASLHPIDVSAGTTNHEQVSLAGLPAGTYYAQVYGYAGATNPAYSLTINAAPPPADRFEPNDSFSTARDLGTVQGRRTEAGLSIHLPGNDDWSKFTTVATSTPAHSVGITFDGRQGDLDLELYTATRTLLAWSRGVGDSEAVSLAALPAGTYYVRVNGYNGATNPDYSLTIAAAKHLAADAREPNDSPAAASNLGPVRDRLEIDDLSIHRNPNGTSNEDWFRFDMIGGAISGHAVRIDFASALGDLDLALYRGSDTSTPLRTSAGIGDSEQISLAGLAAGTYYARVYGYDGDTNPDYSLTLDAPGGTAGADRFEPDNTLATAHDFGDVRGMQSWGFDRRADDPPLSIHDGTDQDWFRFNMSAAGTAGNLVRIAFLHSQGDLDLELYNASSTRLARSAGVGDSEQISLAGLPAGVYYVKVYGYSGAANPAYSLTINAPGGDRFEPNDTAMAATTLNSAQGDLQGAQTWGGDPDPPLSIAAGDEDWFQFTTVRAGRMGDLVRIDFLHAQGDLDLALFRSGDTTMPLRRSIGVSDGEQVSLEGLAAGTYFVRVYGYHGVANPSYSLTIDAPENPVSDWAEPNNTAATARDLGLVQGLDAEQRPLSIDTAGDVDWFQIQITRAGQAPHFAAITFNHAEGDLDLELYSSSNTTTPLRRSTGVSNLQSISLATLAAGSYYLRVFGYDNATNPRYFLTINAPAALTPDTAEPNDTASIARDLRVVSGQLTKDKLSIDTSTDQDWFKFQLGAPGGAGHFAAIAFDQGLGDLDLRLYAADGTTLLASSMTATSPEQISLQDRPAGTYYYLQVSGYHGATNPDYSLAINAPRAAGDWAESNDTPVTSQDLRQVEGPQTFTDLSVHRVGDTDWFKFQTVAAGMEGDFVGIAFDQSLGDLDIELYTGDNTTTPIRCSRGTGNTERISLAGLAAGTYDLRVYGYAGATNPSYAIAMSAPRRNVQPDWAEPNDSAAAAADLQQVEGFRAWTNLSIHTANNSDWFLFTTTGRGVDGDFVSIVFDHRLGDLDLALYASPTATTPLLSSTGTGDRELISLANRPAGTYYLRVYGYNGATSPLYSLGINAPRVAHSDFAEPNNTLATAYNLREVSGQIALGSLSIDTTTDQDWFHFTTLAPGVAGHRVRIHFAAAAADLELALYDASGSPLASSATTGDFEEISLEGRAAGTYYLRVIGTSAATNPEYTLSIAAPDSAATIPPDWAESNDTRATAYDLRSLARSNGSRLSDSRVGGDFGAFASNLSGILAQGNAPLSLFRACAEITFTNCTG